MIRLGGSCVGVTSSPLSAVVVVGSSVTSESDAALLMLAAIGAAPRVSAWSGSERRSFEVVFLAGGLSVLE
jgi:hypothetical protein